MRKVPSRRCAILFGAVLLTGVLAACGGSGGSTASGYFPGNGNDFLVGKLIVFSKVNSTMPSETTDGTITLHADGTFTETGTNSQGTFTARGRWWRWLDLAGPIPAYTNAVRMKYDSVQYMGDPVPTPLDITMEGTLDSSAMGTVTDTTDPSWTQTFTGLAP